MDSNNSPAKDPRRNGVNSLEIVAGGNSSSSKWSFQQISDLPSAAASARDRSDLPHSVSVPNSSGHNNGGSSDDCQNYDDPDHFNCSFSSLNEFRHNSFLSDVNVKVEDRIFACHRVILAAAVPYFRSMFASEMRESQSELIEIKDIQANAFETLLGFVYTSTLNLTQDNVQSLLFAGSILQMDAVCSACEKYLEICLTTQNCLAIRAFAQQHNCVQLMRSVDQFAQKLMNSDDFLTITFPHLLDLISSNDLNVTTEEQVFDAIFVWIKHDPTVRLRYLARLISKVRLCRLDSGYLINTVRGNEFIQESSECCAIVSNAMACQMVAADMAPNTTTNIEYELCRPRKSTAGVIFCVGGRGTTGDPFRSIEAYHWGQNKWMSVAEMGTKRRHVGVVSAHSKLYAIGGHDGQEHLSSAEVFDPRNNQWRLVNSMNTHRRGIAVGFLRGAIYAVGGLDDSACFKTVERYDIEGDRWQLVADMNIQRGGVGVAALKGHLYAVGGNDGTSSLDSSERYDPHLDKWSLVQNMSHRRAGAGVVVLGGLLYVIGGFDDNSPLKTCECYNPDSNEWSLLPEMSCPRGGVGVAPLGGRIYAVGGHDGSSYLNTVEAYDPYTNRWEGVGPISYCRAGAGVAWCYCPIDILQPLAAINVASCV